jgi:E3 ubiquitin-protein ligase RNF14
VTAGTVKMFLAPESLADERSQELDTLAAIYSDELTLLPPFSALLTLPVTPTTPLVVSFCSSGDPSLQHLTHLPSIQLKFTLPVSYPASAPPELELSTNPAWLPRPTLAALTQQCLDLWEEYGHGQVLFAITDHIQASAERCFSIPHPLQLSPDLREPLLSFDRTAKQEIFDRSTYDCGICLEPKKGTQCHAIRSCTHIFCRPCLVDYYTALITDGDVSSVLCSDPECIKAATRLATVEPPTLPPESTESKPAVVIPHPTLPPDELAEIGLPLELVTRYTTLKKKKALEVDPETIYCPRQWCQSASRSSLFALESAMSSSHASFWLSPRHPTHPSSPNTSILLPLKSTTAGLSRAERLQLCSSCDFAFCRNCRNSWHGDYVICKAVDRPPTADEIANEEFLKANTTTCPSCFSPALKSYGCNHMICRCGSHFCFLCSAYLVASDPYAHFNNRSYQCYQRLWEGEDGDEENRRLVAAREADEEREEPMAWLLEIGVPVGV